jgi:NAD(P)-dependent dehydrogenase (short-subunit alcohol dehydrogenase family)
MSAQLFDLTGRTIVITGALGQLGRAYTRALVQAGARVALLDLVPPGPELAGAALAQRVGVGEGSAGALAYFQVNVTERASLEAALAAIQAHWGVTPDGLVNNAALDSPPGAPAEENGPFETYPEASWDKVMTVNTKGPFLCCQVFGGAMAEVGLPGGGSIINIGSIYGVVSPNQTIYEYRRGPDKPPFYKPVAYSASKSALLNLTRYLATYWAPRGVRVNTLTLAGVFNHQDKAFLDSYLPHVPLGRMADPADYLGPIIFLLSDASRYMSGANLVIDGGWTAW